VRYETAPMSMAIKVISVLMVALTAGLFVASAVRREFLIPATLLGAITFGCYLRAPVAYYASRTGLTVLFRLGRRTFGRILKTSPVHERVGFTLRLWGNGGLFAGTGIFWNRQWGLFRAYVTTSHAPHLVLVETETSKVLISPAHSEELLAGHFGREDAGK
jgi:hypothetical protein